jgi:hypothetical protein
MHTFRLIGAEIRKTQTEGFTEFGWKGTRGVTQNATGPHFWNEHFFAMNLYLLAHQTLVAQLQIFVAQLQIFTWLAK